MPSSTLGSRVVDPEILGAVDGYVSRSLSADEFAAVREFARNVVGSLHLESPLSAKNAMRDVSWLAAWCESVAIPLEIKYVFDPATITRYIEDGCQTESATARRTYRANLRRIALEVAPRLQPPAESKFPRWVLKRPYTAEEVAEFLVLADHQPTEKQRQRLLALLCLGLGAGLRPGEYQHVKPADVYESDGTVVVVAGSRERRTVPVLDPFGKRLLGVALSTSEAYLLGGSPASDRRNAVGSLIHRVKGGGHLPPITPGALRATWLAFHFQHLGLDALMAGAGVTWTHAFEDLARTLPVPDSARISEVLRGSM